MRSGPGEPEGDGSRTGSERGNLRRLGGWEPENRLWERSQ